MINQPQLPDDWDVFIDNDFAKELFRTIMTSPNTTMPHVRISSTLCGPCKDLRAHVWDSPFDKSYLMSHLKANAELRTCDLCGLFWRTCERHGTTRSTAVLVERAGSFIRMNATSSVTLPITRSSGKITGRSITIHSCGIT